MSESNGNDKLKAALLEATNQIEFHWEQCERLKAALLGCAETFAFLEEQEAVFTPAFCWTPGHGSLKQRIQEEMARRALELQNDPDHIQNQDAEAAAGPKTDGDVDQAGE